VAEFAQVVVTDDQAVKIAGAIALALENSTDEQLGEHAEELKALAVFFGVVSTNPERFPVTGRMATAIKDAKKQDKGPAQPASRRNRRKLRQLTRQGGAKRRRQQHAEDVANFNQAREAMAAELAEMQQIQEEDQAKLEALLAQEVLTPAELTRVLALFHAPPVVIEAASKVRGGDEGWQHLPEPPQIILP
jgi:hypothetical protein